MLHGRGLMNFNQTLLPFLFSKIYTQERDYRKHCSLRPMHFAIKPVKANCTMYMYTYIKCTREYDERQHQTNKLQLATARVQQSVVECVARFAKSIFNFQQILDRNNIPIFFQGSISSLVRIKGIFRCAIDFQPIRLRALSLSLSTPYIRYITKLFCFIEKEQVHVVCVRQKRREMEAPFSSDHETDRRLYVSPTTYTLYIYRLCIHILRAQPFKVRKQAEEIMCMSVRSMRVFQKDQHNERLSF